MTIHILMTGSAGHGKSTLGNLLANPDKLKRHTHGQNEDFTTGNQGEVVTTEIKISDNFRVDGIGDDIRIIDTPGFLEGIKADILNVGKILKELEEIKINAILYVYSGRTKAPFTELTTFYKRLFPKDALEKNLILVRTSTPEGDRHPSAEQRRVINMKESKFVMELMGLDTPPIIISIDSTPNNDSGWQTAYEKRLSLLITASRLTPIEMKGLKIPKLQAMIDRDKQEAQAKTKEIKEKDKLKDVPGYETDRLLAHVRNLREKHSHELERIKQYETKLDIYDTEEPVNVNYSTREGIRGLGKSLTLTTHTRDDIPIICDSRGYHLEPFARHRGDEVSLTGITQSCVTVEMKPASVLGETGGILYARVFKKDKYASEVSRYNELLSSSQEHLLYFQQEMNKAIRESDVLQKHYTDKLNNEIAELEVQRAELLDIYINFEKLIDDEYISQYAG